MLGLCRPIIRLHRRHRMHVLSMHRVDQSLVGVLHDVVQIKQATWQMLRRQHHVAVEYVAAGA